MKRLIFLLMLPLFGLGACKPEVKNQQIGVPEASPAEPLFSPLPEANLSNTPVGQVTPDPNILAPVDPRITADQIRLVFEPKKDITAYELSQLLPFLMGQSVSRTEWNKLDKHITRHCREIKADEIKK